MTGVLFGREDADVAAVVVGVDTSQDVWECGGGRRPLTPRGRRGEGGDAVVRIHGGCLAGECEVNRWGRCPS